MMKLHFVLQIILLVVMRNFVCGLSSEEVTEVQETCCAHGEVLATKSTTVRVCAGSTDLPENVELEQVDTCQAALQSCCERQFKLKDDCSTGMKFASEKRCSVPKSDIGKTCCEECSFGQWTGESQGKEACGEPVDEDVSPTTALRKNAYYQCCLNAAEKPETTTEKKVETTTEKKIVKEKCKPGSCEQICNDDDGRIMCLCRDGFRLQSDRKSCKDINECAEALDDLCTKEGTVCHNTPGSFKCVPIKKRDVGLTCPPGFKRNLQNQVCDDINECQLPRPPCPKYLCENTIGGYKCAGKPGKPVTETIPGATTESNTLTTSTPKNDICPPGFRAGPDDECVDIDECEESLDDCQRLSQYCINTNGNFFCQDHVSKRCAPGFKINAASGICEDIDECEESTEVCKRTEVCVNLAGAYDCKSKISTLPKLATKTCQEGTRVRPGGSICEDIDECREGTHLCDQFQNCINTFGGHECRCKSGFELDTSSGSCVDIDECALKLDNCGAGLHCLNVLGSFTCTRRSPTTSTTTTTTLSPAYEYEYYDSDEENGTTSEDSRPVTPVLPVSSTTVTPKPTVTPRITTSTSTTTPRSTTPRTTTPRPTIKPKSTTTTKPTTTPTSSVYPVRPTYGFSPFAPTTNRTPFTNRPPERPVPRPTSTQRPEYTPTRTEATRPTRPEPTLPTRPEYTPSRPDYPPSLPSNKPEHEDPTRPEGTPTSSEVTPSRKPETPEGSAFDSDNFHCLNGYERNANGECEDINECELGRHICSNLEDCQNRAGGYVCQCIAGFRRDPSGWCIVSTPATRPPTRPTPTTERTSTTSTTQSATSITSTAVTSSRPYMPTRPYNRPYVPPIICELGYTFDRNLGKCVDIDECATNKATCSPNEDCINIEGGFRCVCGRRCRGDNERPSYGPPFAEPPPYETPVNPNVITVGAQYGQRGPRYLRPTYTRLPTSGAIVTTCPWGYKLTGDKQCFDVDECARNISECGPQQRCENFYGGYACQCPAGHRLVGQDGCEDVDECSFGNPCSYNAQCINTVGSYRCTCGEGFRNAPTNDKVCVDVDECAETPGVCQQACANAWGGYRCYCNRGYRLHSDNRTCVDVDECAEWSSARVRGRLCGGECVNVPGSYRCACPAGYKLSDDGRSCIDIDECETGEASCAHSSDRGDVCQNTRGSYHCHHIDCPPGYRLESKHRCSRIQRSCPMSDWSCLRQPSTYSYNFITFVANIYLPAGSVDLFTMHGPAWSDSVVSFEMGMIDTKAPSGVTPADLSCFDMRPQGNVCVVSLLCSLGGPQVVQLELTMSLYQRNQFAGSAVARLIVIVSQYDF